MTTKAYDGPLTKRTYRKGPNGGVRYVPEAPRTRTDEHSLRHLLHPTPVVLYSTQGPNRQHRRHQVDRHGRVLGHFRPMIANGRWGPMNVPATEAVLAPGWEQLLARDEALGRARDKAPVG